MRRNPSSSPERATMNAALSGGLSAILGGTVFVGGLIAMDFHGLHTLLNTTGWFPALGLLGGIVGSFGMVGFALGPLVAALARTDGDGR